MGSPLTPRLKRWLYSVVGPLLYGRFYFLKEKTGGMPHPTVYRRLYRLAREGLDLDIVEIGGAGGAGSIALAKGQSDAGKRGRVIVVEKCEGGSRTLYGDYTDNKACLERHFERFRVRDRIRLFPHSLTEETGPEVKKLIEIPQIAALVHDADGRIDRDLKRCSGHFSATTAGW